MLIALERGIEGNKWFSLIDKVASERTLGIAWEKARSNAGSCDVDGISVAFFEDVLLCSQVGLAGSSHFGDGAVLAGKVGVADHRKIGANSVLMAKSGVTRDIPAGEIYYGMPARPVRETLCQYSLIAQLDEMKDRIVDLERGLDGDNHRAVRS
ncbi:MAG: hypothetical protein KDN22_16160 [Verrucomicrobiae bacterium]|nr:hypothetical protein [Verrucomicrobiae bacterium]